MAPAAASHLLLRTPTPRLVNKARYSHILRRRNPVTMTRLLSTVLESLLFATRVAAQQFPLPVTYDAILTSPINPNITISYKQPTPGTCATVFATQKQYSGYVNLPPFTLAPYQQNYSINTFFWFFEARENPETASLTIWLNGGPGSSSMFGLFQEIGPCEIIQLPNGSYSTQPRPFGWDRSSNLLFIDQPTQTGFSYDELVNASVDFSKDKPFVNESRVSPSPLPPDTPAWRFMNGTFSSGQDENTQDSTAIAARSCWHFLQGFLSAFPQYNPGTRPNRTTIEPAGVNLFAESYGGTYGPTFADYFEEQNDRRTNGAIPNSALEIRLESVGIVNGMMDYVTSAIEIVEFLYNNTYKGASLIDQRTYIDAMSRLLNSSDTGCLATVSLCRSQARVLDPDDPESVERVDKSCRDAQKVCDQGKKELFGTAQRNPYDVRVALDIGPSDVFQEYLNTEGVMQSIGARVNFTQSSAAVTLAFNRSEL
jgi:carboxypeptidase C (cathepsin A)